ncbi:MAG: protein kinase [Planctomycetaceae bacterium]|nr:protein kinase [Planctomycetaceae bacterium]
MNSSTNFEHDPLAVFCPACNAAFAVLDHPRDCPRCGMPLRFEGDATLPTLLLHEDQHVTPASNKGADRCLQDLLGAEFGNYDVETLLGRGGMGWVFLARHRQLRRPCALKILSPELVKNDPEYLSRFHTEGEAAASLVHPNIVTVHAIGEEQGLHYLEMEFIPGRSLQVALRGTRLPPLRAVTITAAIAQGLSAAHRQGVLHQDLKPDNVLMTHQGIPKLADFGLCKRLQSSALESKQLAGTPHFMAPELFMGSPASKQSDVYSLGVCLFFLLTGQLPYARANMNSLIAAVTQDPLPGIRDLAPEVPLELGEVVGMMLDKTPANRPCDGIEALQLLQAVLGHAQDLESLLHEALENEPHIQWNRLGARDAFQAETLLSNGRRQTVYVEVSDNSVHQRLVQIYSVCCPAVAEFYSDALRLNSILSHGAIAIRNLDGNEHFVVLNSYPRSTVDAEELRRTILEIGHHADAIERQLTGGDIF